MLLKVQISNAILTQSHFFMLHGFRASQQLIILSKPFITTVA